MMLNYDTRDICPMDLQFYLIQVNKISFVEPGKKCGILFLVYKNVISVILQS